MTETIKVEVDEDLARQFKRKAMEKFGYKKGAMKKALVEAMKSYSSGQQRKQAKADWSDLRGLMTSEKDSVWLQHHAWDKTE